MSVRILSDVAVTPNLQAEVKSTCACPTMCRLANGDIVLIYREGETKHSLDGVLKAQRSTDGGQSWSKPISIYDGTNKTIPESVHNGALCQANDGSVVAIFTATEVKNADAFIYSEEGREQRQILYVATSQDGGKTWAAPQEHKIPEAPPLIYNNARPLSLSNGDLLVPFDVMGPQNQVFAMNSNYSPSRNAFEPLVMAAGDESATISYGDAKLARLADGRILMLIWAFVTASDETIDVQRCVSSNDGKTWSKPESIGIRCQITMPLALVENHVIAASNVRVAPDGIHLWHSNDNGQSFHADAPIQMWHPQLGRAVGEPLRATDGAQTEGGKVWQALAGFTFGNPDMVLLDDRSVLLTYYATLEATLHVRACRFQVQF